MRRQVALALAVAVGVGIAVPASAAITYTPPCTTSSDSCRQRRIQALESKAAELEGRIAALETPTPRATPAASVSPSPPASPTPSPPQPAPTNGQFTPAYWSKWTNGPSQATSYYPVGVWIQDPNRVRNGRSNALNYRDAGVNTFVGQWDFPTRSDSESRLATIKAAGMSAWAADAPVNLPSVSALAGYQFGDEQDMNKAGPCGAGCNSDVVARDAAALKAADPTRPVTNNFGKGFALYPWIGYHSDVGPTDEDELRRYCSNVDVASSDYYAATDGWESADRHTPRQYGLAVRNVMRFCGDGAKPVLGFVETGHPFDEAQCQSWAPYSTNCTISPDGLEWAVWSMVANGANGVIYFCHDFYTNAMAEDGVFDHPANLSRMTAVNAELARLAPILNTARTPTGLTAVNADATLRGGYVVAAENSGTARTASFTVASAAGRTVTVVGEGRTVAADSAGRWADQFTGWGHHVYQIS